MKIKSKKYATKEPDEKGLKPSDCLSACFSSLTGEDISHFEGITCDNALQEKEYTESMMNDLGFKYSFVLSKEPIASTCIAIGFYRDKKIRKSVIMKGKDVLHDPTRQEGIRNPHMFISLVGSKDDYSLF
jgi:hypothetical protein